MTVLITMKFADYFKDTIDVNLMAFDSLAHWYGQHYRDLETRLTSDAFMSQGLPYKSWEDLLMHESPWLYQLATESLGARAGRRYFERHGKEHDAYKTNFEVFIHPEQFVSFTLGLILFPYNLVRGILEESRFPKNLSKRFTGFKSLSPDYQFFH